MANFPPASTPAVRVAADDAAIWSSLQEAIAKSSGFATWKRGQEPAVQTDEGLVRRYLRETLETLAY